MQLIDHDLNLNSTARCWWRILVTVAQLLAFTELLVN